MYLHYILNPSISPMQMERYAQKLRELKMRKARDRLGQATSEPPPIDMDEELGAQDMVSAVTKALAQRWVRMARDHLESKFRYVLI
ncbi:hypothetical protein EON64_00025 [archaeon]|nr:MAG: hypothetical protein EON64_00025 [archaeon]